MGRRKNMWKESEKTGEDLAFFCVFRTKDKKKACVCCKPYATCLWSDHMWGIRLMACDFSSGFCIGAVLCQNCCFSSAVLEAELSNPLWFFCLIPTVRAAGLNIHRSNVVETTVVSLVLQRLNDSSYGENIKHYQIMLVSLWLFRFYYLGNVE